MEIPDIDKAIVTLEDLKSSIKDRLDLVIDGIANLTEKANKGRKLVAGVDGLIAKLKDGTWTDQDFTDVDNLFNEMSKDTPKEPPKPIHECQEEGKYNVSIFEDGTWIVTD